MIASAFAVGTLQRYGVSKDTQELSTLDMLVIRLVNNGDALIYSYPNGFIERLDGRNPVRALLKDYLLTFRIVSPDELPEHIGAQDRGSTRRQWKEFYDGRQIITCLDMSILGFCGSILYSYLWAVRLDLYVIP